MKITDLDNKLYSEQTGRFLIMSNHGNCYVVIFYAVDVNYNKSYPIKSHHHSQILQAYDDMYDFLRVQGYQPQLHKRDNETSKDVKKFIAEQQSKVQYTLADIHCTNISKQCFRTWKNYCLHVPSVKNRKAPHASNYRRQSVSLSI